MDAVNLVEAARTAIYQRLAATSGVPMFDHTPAGTEPPFRKLGEIEWEAAGSKFDPVIVLTVEVISIYRGQDRSVVIDMAHANDRALHDATIEIDGAVVSQVAQVAGSVSSAAADGVTYAALQLFEMNVEPA